MAKSKTNHKATVAGISGSRRDAHFANGGTLAEWRGGLATRIPSGKAYKRGVKHKGSED